MINMDILYFQLNRLNKEYLYLSIIQKLGFSSILMNPGMGTPFYLGAILLIDGPRKLVILLSEKQDF
jgi:hypothetical protein